jgi:dTMP kinase
VRKGGFITFEGGEGTGKSTQVRRLAERLREAGQETVVTREPGGSPGAEEIRSLLVGGAVDRWSARTETLLLYAARSDHLQRVIGPALERGRLGRLRPLLRFHPRLSRLRGLAGPADGARKEVVQGDRPDLTLVFDLPASEGLARVTKRGEATTRFEARDETYHEGLRQAYLEIARAEPERCVVIDARPSPDAVAEAVWSAVEARLRP